VDAKVCLPAAEAGLTALCAPSVCVCDQATQSLAGKSATRTPTDKQNDLSLESINETLILPNISRELEPPSQLRLQNKNFSPGCSIRAALAELTNSHAQQFHPLKLCHRALKMPRNRIKVVYPNRSGQVNHFCGLLFHTAAN